MLVYIQSDRTPIALNVDQHYYLLGVLRIELGGALAHWFHLRHRGHIYIFIDCPSTPPPGRRGKMALHGPEHEAQSENIVPNMHLED